MVLVFQERCHPPLHWGHRGYRRRRQSRLPLQQQPQLSCLHRRKRRRHKWQNSRPKLKQTEKEMSKTWKIGSTTTWGTDWLTDWRIWWIKPVWSFMMSLMTDRKEVPFRIILRQSPPPEGFRWKLDLVPTKTFHIFFLRKKRGGKLWCPAVKINPVSQVVSFFCCRTAASRVQVIALILTPLERGGKDLVNTSLSIRRTSSSYAICAAKADNVLWEKQWAFQCWHLISCYTIKQMRVRNWAGWPASNK